MTLALLGCGDTEPTEQPTAASNLPDIVFVTMDTTRADRIGAYGYSLAKTPVIDELAKNGRRYDRAYSPMPLTIPAHATMFTGQQPPTHGLRSNGTGRLSPDAETLAEHLRDAGYQTAASVSAFVTTRRWGLDQGFDAYFDEFEQETNYWQSQRPAGDVVDDLLRWKEISSLPNTPSFVWAHLYDPHFPYAAPEPFRTEMPDRPYDAEIAYMDAQIGRLVEAFSGKPTIFVLAGDHGESLGAHGEFTHGFYVYDVTQHVPLIMSGPGLDPMAVPETVSLADIAPTLLDLLGLPPMTKAEGRVAPGSDPVPVYMESYQLSQRFGIGPHVAVVHNEKKYIDTPRPELYALGTRETQNLADTVDVSPWRTQLLKFGYAPPDQDELHMDPSVAAQLAALGYLEGSAEIDPSAPLRDPKDHTAMLQQAQEVDQLIALGETVRAEASLKDLSEKYPDVAEFRNRRAKMLGDMGRLEEALAMIVEIRANDPDDPTLKQSHATLLAKLDHFDRAAVLYQEVATELPELPGARTAAFVALDSSGDHDGALALADAYLVEHPDDFSLAGAVGLALVKRGELAIALQMLELGARAARPERDVCFHLGAARVGQRDMEGAIELYERELHFWPENKRARLSYVGGLTATSKDREFQLEQARILVEKVPEIPESYRWLAQAHFNLKQDSEAQLAVDKGQAIDASDPDLMILEANLLSRAGKKDEGAVMFDKANAEAQRRAAFTKQAPPPTPK